ncbi:MAG TPA: hypothetical protein VGG99_19410 [Acetobacteraceae bacterium]|jgi:hypothetical protein
MLDLVGIVVSGVMILFVVFRAVQLDRTLPWFVTIKPPADRPDATSSRTPPRQVWSRVPRRR